MLIVLDLIAAGIIQSIFASDDPGGDGYGLQIPEAAAMRQQEQQQVANSNNGHVLCPSAIMLFDNTTELEEAIASNINFHQRGGNLRSIERYLNRHQQNTLDMLGIRFIPHGQLKATSNAMKYLRDYFTSNGAERGGYGQPLPGKYSAKHGVEVIHNVLAEDRWINVIEPATRERFAAGIGPVGPECSKRVELGKEKTLCIPSKLQQGQQKQNNLLQKEECNIFSIGGNDQWDFEVQVLRKIPGFVTHTFDCTLKDDTPRRKPQSKKVKFYPHCIGSNDTKAPYLPYEQLVEATQTKSPPSLLKMDVEGFEYDVFDSILSSDPSLWPEQIMMEIHWSSRMVDLPWMPRTRTAAEISMFLGRLFNQGGYIMTHTFVNGGCYPCMEVLLARVSC